MLGRLRQIGLLCAAAACTSLAAFAHTAGAQPPRAVDFEQPLPPLERVQFTGTEAQRSGKHDDELGHGPVSFRSSAIDAPRRFDLVGIAGELRPVEFRARTTGGRWSDWVEVAGGDPVYTGGSNEVQVRARGWHPRGRLHYIQVSGTGSIPASPAGKARPRMPDVIRRQAWGANRRRGGCHPRKRPDMGEVKAATIHHTVSTNGYRRSEVPGIVLGICRFHRNGNGWDDIGYNALVDRFGRIFVGRDGDLGKPVVGAHAQGFNDQTTGVAAIGTHTHGPISKRAKNAFARFLAWKFDRHEIKPRQVKRRARLTSDGGPLTRYPRGRKVWVPRVFGHGRTGITSCPGRALRGQLDGLARATVHRMRRQRNQGAL
jgi:hypothetical protein